MAMPIGPIVIRREKLRIVVSPAAVATEGLFGFHVAVTEVSAQSRERSAKSFPWQSVKTKTGLRIIVVGLTPLLLLLYGAIRSWRRRRPVLVP